MAKTTNFILGLAFLALGVLGITNIVPMFASDPMYINIIEILLGSLGLLIGIYYPQSNSSRHLPKVFSVQSSPNADLQNQEIENLKKQLEQQQKENEVRQLQENERLKKLLADQQKENDERQQKETEQLKKKLEEQQQENEKLRKQGVNS